MANKDDIELLVRSPRESLAVELKAWIRPDVPKERAKLIKALLALRNNNGGYLLIGFDDKTGSPLPCPADLSVDDLYHADRMQELAAKYSSESFEVVTRFVDVNSARCVVLQVPSGLKVPAVAKKAFQDSGTILVAEGAVYVRSLNANNRVSTSLIGVQDWPALMERCFENRESDIGRFLRRHLGAEAAEGLGATLAPMGKSRDPAQNYLASRTASFLERAARCQGDKPILGAVEVALTTWDHLPAELPSNELLSRVMAANPELSGWPAWVDSRSFDKESRPKVIDRGWEAFIHARLFSAWAIDDWRIEPIGRLYLGRALRDDLWIDQGPVPGTVLDFSHQIVWLAEALKVAVSMLVALGATNEARVSVAVRWSGLEGRELSSWMSPGRHIWPGRFAHQNELTVCQAMSLDELSAIRVVAEGLISELFVLFDGQTFSSQVYDELIEGRLNRKV